MDVVNFLLLLMNEACIRKMHGFFQASCSRSTLLLRGHQFALQSQRPVIYGRKEGNAMHVTASTGVLAVDFCLDFTFVPCHNICTQLAYECITLCKCKRVLYAGAAQVQSGLGLTLCRPKNSSLMVTSSQRIVTKHGAFVEGKSTKDSECVTGRTFHEASNDRAAAGPLPTGERFLGIV